MGTEAPHGDALWCLNALQKDYHPDSLDMTSQNQSSRGEERFMGTEAPHGDGLSCLHAPQKVYHPGSLDMIKPAPILTRR